MRRLTAVVFAAGLALVTHAAQAADIKLLNVSYDPTRELYVALNKAFIADYKKKTGDTVTISQSHGGSGKQARAVIDGLDGDVATLALAADIDSIARIAKLLPPNWQRRLPDNSSPYTSTIVFVVRKGNPKKIRDWNDLTKADVKIITPNPKTSGGARWAYLAAWAYAAHLPSGNANSAKAFVGKLYRNAPVLDSGARGATTSFAQRGIGDVLLSWENEARLALAEFDNKKFEIIYPPSSILAEPPVALLDRNVDKRGTRKAADAYLKFLYTPQAQQIIAKNHYRPRDKAVLAANAKQFPALKLYTIDKDFGGWSKAQAVHFADGGVFDQIYTPAR